MIGANYGGGGRPGMFQQAAGRGGGGGVLPERLVGARSVVGDMEGVVPPAGEQLQYNTHCRDADLALDAALSAIKPAAAGGIQSTVGMGGTGEG